jgi:hypothetical protein
MQNTTLESLPRTGRIGRYVKILETKVNEDTLLRILENAENYNIMPAEQKSSWWKNALYKMEKELGAEKATQIMTCCGEKCCGKGQRKTARRLMQEAGSLEEFLVKISKHGVKEGELEYQLENENTIIGKYNKCFCKQVAKTKEPFEAMTYCQCSAEFNRQFFAAALEKEVKVTLEQSIICGAKYCKFIVTF